MNDKAKEVGVATKAPAVAQGAGTPARASDPFSMLHDEIERVFDRFGTGWPLLPSFRALTEMDPFKSFGTMPALPAVGAPSVDISETDKAYEISAELPGMSEKDIELNLREDVLELKGEKKNERTEEKKDYHLVERSYGAFRRAFRLPEGVDGAKITAKMVNGVLHVTVPKSEEQRKRSTKVPISAG